MLTMLMYPGLMPRGSTVKRMKCFFPRTTMGFGSPPNSTLIGCPLINTVDKASTKRSTWGLVSMSNLCGFASKNTGTIVLALMIKFILPATRSVRFLKPILT